ncbi:MAG: hypothetical protein R3332_10410 [Pseudohongiellaceae bacterium]|nr:hypothetical protein [Pseudohongiellaceae bacterium]
MKRLLAQLIVTGACAVAASQSFAGKTDAYFDAETGKLILPHLVIGDGTFYATLSLTNPETLTFVADFDSITDFTAPSGIGDSVNVSEDDIVGVWGFPGSDTVITLNSDGTYIIDHEPELDDDACPNGGIETGTYTWEPATGVLLSTTLTDENGECGLSHPRDGVPYRIFVSGNNMQILEKGEGAPLEEFAAVRQEG